MTQAIGNDDPDVISAVNSSIALAAEGNHEAAIRLLEQISERFPKASSIRGYLAWYLLEVKRFEDAIDQGLRAVELSPKSELASLVYFHVLWRAGRQIDALEEMKRFLSVKPSETYRNIIKEWVPHGITTSNGRFPTQ